MVRSPLTRGAKAKKKTENEATAPKTDGIPAPKQGQGRAVNNKVAGSRSPDKKSELADAEVGESETEAGKIPPNSVSGSGSSAQASIGKAIQKLDDQAFKPFGPRSRSSSETGSCSEGAFCKGGPRKACGELVSQNDLGVQCDKCDRWYHISCQEVPEPAHDALRDYGKILSWFCSECRVTSKKETAKLLTTLESKVDKLDRDARADESHGCLSAWAGAICGQPNEDD